MVYSNTKHGDNKIRKTDITRIFQVKFKYSYRSNNKEQLWTGSFFYINKEELAVHNRAMFKSNEFWLLKFVTLLFTTHIYI